MHSAKFPRMLRQYIVGFAWFSEAGASVIVGSIDELFDWWADKVLSWVRTSALGDTTGSLLDILGVTPSAIWCSGSEGVYLNCVVGNLRYSFNIKSFFCTCSRTRWIWSIWHLTVGNNIWITSYIKDSSRLPFYVCWLVISNHHRIADVKFSVFEFEFFLFVLFLESLILVANSKWILVQISIFFFLNNIAGLWFGVVPPCICLRSSKRLFYCITHNIRLGHYLVV